MTDQLARNKRAVERFFEVIYGDGSNVDEVLDEIVAEDYAQHNDHVAAIADGREGVKRFFVEELGLPLPGHLAAEGTIAVNLIAEGDLVVRQEFRAQGMLVDIFRVQDGVLQEHWDAFRVAPGQEPLPGF